ncbi:hypothetical protein [Comamonas thiooxydans]|nr:hypothetical protein [Comamonas thiooxydans]
MPQQNETNFCFESNGLDHVPMAVQAAIHAWYEQDIQTQDFKLMANTFRLDDDRFMALKNSIVALDVLKYRPGSKNVPTLVDGHYFENPLVDPAWVLSIYRNVKTKGNDVEITVVHDRLPFQHVDGESVEQWLKTMKRELQHLEPGRRGGTLPNGTIRVGLKYENAQTFLSALCTQLRYTIRSPISDPVTTLALKMMQTVKSTCQQSGASSTVVAKIKEWRFQSDQHFINEVSALLHAAGARCALTGVQLDFTGGNAEFSPSLDRKDSSGHYEPGNLQIVARFANRWKSDMSDPQFLSLLEAVRRV